MYMLNTLKNRIKCNKTLSDVNASIQGFETTKPTKVEWGFCIGIFVFLFFCFQYVDLESITIWSVNFWDVIFDGDISQLYIYTAQNHRGLYHPFWGGEIFLYLLPHSIWNLPIALIQYYAGIEILTNSLMMAWSRLFLVLSLLVTLKYAYKISMILFNDSIRSWWVVFLSLSSFFVYSGIFYAGQNDIVMVCLSVIGVYYYMKGNMRLFILFFSLSVAVKLVTLFIFIPLILLKEKNVIKIAVALICVVLPIILSRYISSFFPLYTELQQINATEMLLNRIIGNFRLFGIIPVSPFIIAYAIICILCYFIIKLQTDDEQNECAIYMVTATYTVFFIFTGFEPYRTILLIPFLYILVMHKVKILTINIILVLLLQVSCFAASYVRDTWFYDPQVLRNSIYLKIIGLPYSLPSSPIYEPLTVERYALSNFFFIIFTVCALLLIIINYPWLNLELKNRKCGRVFVWLHLAVFLPFVGYTIINYISTYL